MPRTFQRSFPSVDKQMRALGERLKLARLRRELSTALFAERLGISRDTLNRLEKGDPGIALGTYMRALRVLGLDKDMDVVARDDELGRKLQDAKLPGRRRPRTAASAAPGTAEAEAPPPADRAQSQPRHKPQSQPQSQPQSKPQSQSESQPHKPRGKPLDKP